jgi:hypothetical protein
MTEPRIVELWPCGNTARCSAGMPPARHYDPALPRRPGRPDRQTDACDTHASDLCAALRVIDRRH